MESMREPLSYLVPASSIDQGDRPPVLETNPMSLSPMQRLPCRDDTKSTAIWCPVLNHMAPEARLKILAAVHCVLAVSVI